ncbi:hypothetical protein [Nocardia grenadensis]|uniref:hypothetical protein n=1 Tax=Nocardia grenadensis TaxID=931537 RepID=UPI003D71E8DB
MVAPGIARAEQPGITVAAVEEEFRMLDLVAAPPTETVVVDLCQEKNDATPTCGAGGTRFR